MELSLEEKLKLCNELNALAAEGYKIHVSYNTFDSATMIGDQLMGVRFDAKNDTSSVWGILNAGPITASKTAVIDTKTVYTPPLSTEAE